MLKGEAKNPLMNVPMPKEKDHDEFMPPIDNLYLTVRLGKQPLPAHAYVGRFNSLNNILDFYRIGLMKNFHSDKDANWMLLSCYRRVGLSRERVLMDKRAPEAIYKILKDLQDQKYDFWEDTTENTPGPSERTDAEHFRAMKAGKSVISG
jgi:hypothetical protein